MYFKDNIIILNKNNGFKSIFIFDELLILFTNKLL